MKTQEQLSNLKKLNADELMVELINSSRELFNLTIQHATKQLSHTHLLKQLRRKIARIKTIIQEKNRSMK